jgi:cystathionine beta-synthase
MTVSRDPRIGDMSVVSDLTQLIGNTPMVHLKRTNAGIKPLLLAKLELANLGGSTKDRIALEMVLAGEASGALKPGGTIVEPTSGNTGVGLAIVAAERGYKCVFIVPDKVAPEKIALLRAYGAEVHVCPYAVEPDHPDSYYSVASRLSKEIPGAFRPDQYSNPNNPLSHYKTTGPEIWQQTGGRVTHFVAGAGTGGTLSGVGRFLKEQNPNIQVIAADPEGSVYSGGEGRPYLVEGVGEDFWPTTYDQSIVDRVIAVSDADSFNTARRVSRTEGLLIGGSCGTAVAATLRLATDLDESAVVVTLLPDSGRGYLSKLYNDAWMADHGFLRSSGPTVGELLRAKTGAIPDFVHVHPEETVRQVISVLREFDVSQMPVVKHEPPLAMAEIVGAANEADLLRASFGDPGYLDRPIGQVMGRPLPVIGIGQSIDEAVKQIDRNSALVVLDDGHPVGIITSSDVLEYLASAKPN